MLKMYKINYLTLDNENFTGYAFGSNIEKAKGNFKKQHNVKYINSTIVFDCFELNYNLLDLALLDTSVLIN